MKKLLRFVICVALAFPAMCGLALARDQGNLIDQAPNLSQPESFETWLGALQTEAIAAGISQGTVDAALSRITLDERVIARDQNQPETTQTFSSYSTHTVSTDRIEDGRVMYHRYAPLLKIMYKNYGVQPEVVVALWGMESNFGRNSGDYNIVSSLATLAYESRRGPFFRQQLIDALRILDQEHMPADDLRGSWAGAMGQPQFMPTTYLRYAVDYDGDGRRDIWGDEADIFASIANYLAAEGWKPDSGWGRPVVLTKPISEQSIGLDHKRDIAAWNKLGVRTTNGNPLPKSDRQAALVQPDGLDGRSFLVYDNFRALMRWNRSTYFAASVGLLADSVAHP